MAARAPLTAYVLHCRHENTIHVPDTVQVPDTVLASILQHVPLQQPLTNCAQVCHAWARAAELATTEVHVAVRSQENCQHLQDWLQTFGDGVVNISTSTQGCHTNPTLQLPCHKLTQLQVEAIRFMPHTPQPSVSTQISASSSRATTAAHASIHCSGNTQN